MNKKGKKMEAHIKTNKGTIKLTLFYEYAPITVSNFVNLSQRGYYDNLSFHRVIDNFMIQGGCPLGTGTGGPGYNFQDEFHDEFHMGYIDESGVRMALEFLSEDEQIYFDNRTEKYVLIS